MPGEGELEEAVFVLGALADVVDDPGAWPAIGCRDDEGDVGQFSGDGAGDEVAREVVGGVLGDG